jgi:hypothetical protein
MWKRASGMPCSEFGFVTEILEALKPESVHDVDGLL